MADKRRYTVTIPDHVADAIEAHAKPLGATPTEYAADVLRWWFGQGCPAVSHDEIALRAQKLAQAMTKRVKPVPKDINALALDAEDFYHIDDDNIVKKLLTQLGLPNLFAQEAEHDKIRMSLVFDNHPTHWIMVDFFKGSDRPNGDGLRFRAQPKVAVSRDQLRRQVDDERKEMEAKEPFSFSQIPLYEEKNSGNQTPTGALRSSVRK